MKAVTCTNAKLEVVDQPTPTPGKGQLLIDVLRCGICGSDLHARHHCDELAEVMAETGYDDFMRSDQHVVRNRFRRGASTEPTGQLESGRTFVWAATDHPGTTEHPLWLIAGRFIDICPCNSSSLNRVACQYISPINGYSVK